MFTLSLIFDKSVYAIPVTEVITPTAWQSADGDFLTFAQTSTVAPNETIASRDAPGTIINPGLDSPEPVGGSGNEFSTIIIPALQTTCPGTTPVNITVSSYTRELIAEDPSPNNDSYTINGGLIDLNGPTVSGYSIDSMTTVGSYTDSDEVTYSTTIDNLGNVAAFVNFEAATFTGGSHYQGTAELGLPTITLSYDNASCSSSATVTSASSDTTPRLASTGESKGQVSLTGATLVIVGAVVYVLKSRLFQFK